MPYSYRICFRSTGVGTIYSDEESLSFTDGLDGIELTLTSGTKGKSINNVDRYVISGGQYRTEQMAYDAAARMRIVLLRYSLSEKKGLDLGQHKEKFFQITDYGKAWIAKYMNLDGVEPDHLGVTVYPSEAKPAFVRINAACTVSQPVERWIDFIANQNGKRIPKSPKSVLGTEIFAASYFMTNVVVRFLMLFISLEAVFDPLPRSKESIAHVNSLIQNSQSADIPPEESEAIISALSFLKKQSIALTGRHLARSVLGDTTFMRRNPEDFFRYVYALRNDIVHRGKFDESVIQGVIGDFEMFVSEILSAEYIAP